MESMTYNFDEQQQTQARTAQLTKHATVGATAHGQLDASLADHRTRTGTGGRQALTPMEAFWRTIIPWVRVSPDPIITVTGDARTKRGPLRYGGGKVKVA